MKRRILIRKIAKEAKRQDVSWRLHREGSKHSVYSLDDEIIPVPRHAEINELTARGILKQCEPKLGKGWWK